MEVKRREVALSVVIFCVMLLIGFAITGAIRSYQDSVVADITTATWIDSEDGFQYGLKTDYGNVLAYGPITAVEPVNAPDLKGEYIFIEKVTERYTQHTRRVPVHIGKSVVYRTEVYWTWDVIGREENGSAHLKFMGVSFPNNKFSLDTHVADVGYISDGDHLRHYYNVINASYTGTVKTTLKDGTISDNSRVYKGKRQEAVVQDCLKRRECPIVVFWTLWIVLSLLLILKFVDGENKWLDG